MRYREARARSVMLVATIATLAVALADVVAAQTAEANSPLSDGEKLLGLSRIWQEVNYNFPFFDQVPDLDWDSAYVAFVPRVLAARGVAAYYRELQRFMALLRDGHTRVRLPAAVRDAEEIHYPWVLIGRVEGEAVVTNVGESLSSAIPVGSIVELVDGMPATAYARAHHYPLIAASTDAARWDAAVGRLLHGFPDTEVVVTFTTPAGERRTRTLVRDRRTREDAWVRVTERDRFELRWYPGGIAYVALNTFNDPGVADDFAAALPRLLEARALVVDVRYNGGGNSGNGYRILSHLTDDTLATSRWRTRRHVAAYKAWGSAGGEYADYGRMAAWLDGGDHGAIAPAAGRRLVVTTVMLVEHATGSAAEDFLVAADGTRHVTTLGRPSNGSTGQPIRFDLPGGGRAQVVTKRDTYPDGREFVGYGVQPDVLRDPTIEDLVTGRDGQLLEALALLREILDLVDSNR